MWQSEKGLKPHSSRTLYTVSEMYTCVLQLWSKLFENVMYKTK